MNNKCSFDSCLCTRRTLMNYGLLFLAKHSNGTRWCQNGTKSTFLFTLVSLALLLHQRSVWPSKYDGKGDDVSHSYDESGVWIRKRIRDARMCISVASVVLLPIQASVDLKRRTVNKVGSRRGCGCVLHPSSRNSLDLSSRNGSVCVWSCISAAVTQTHNWELKAISILVKYWLMCISGIICNPFLWSSWNWCIWLLSKAPTQRTWSLTLQDDTHQVWTVLSDAFLIERLLKSSWVSCIRSACTFWHTVYLWHMFLSACQTLCQTSQSCILKQNDRQRIATYWNEYSFSFACERDQVFCGWCGQSDARRIERWVRNCYFYSCNN